MFRCGSAQAGGQAAGDLLLGQQGVRPGEGNGQNEGGVEEHQVGSSIYLLLLERQSTRFSTMSFFAQMEPPSAPDQRCKKNSGFNI